MKQIINTEEGKCRGCASCISVCPVGEANIISVEDGKVQIHVDSHKCIACGACLRVCPYNARYYKDDTERFIDELINKEPIAIIVAPAFSSNYSNWKAILSWLKLQGASIISDVSLGIEICTWAHLRYIERNNKAVLITQPCPPIVSYIEIYHPELFNRLSPVLSPILCTAVHLKKVLKRPEKIAALTPCPAKADEFDKSGSVSYNVTFKTLANYLTAHGIKLPNADFEFDCVDVSPGKALTTPSSRPENLLRSIGCISFVGARRGIDIEINRNNVYDYLDLISKNEPGDRPVLLDALNCSGGCHNGAGGSIDNPIIQYTAQKDDDSIGSNYMQTSLFSLFDDLLLLTDYTKPEG